MLFRRAGLVGHDKTRANPDGRCAEHERRCNGRAIVDTTSGNDLYRLASHGACVTSRQLGDGRDEHGRWGVTRMTTTLATLSADEIDTKVKTLLDMLGVTDHVHVKDPVGMEPVDNRLGGYTNSRNENLGAALDDGFDQLVELAFRVVIANNKSVLVFSGLWNTNLVLRALPPIWGSKRSIPNGAFLSCR